MCPKSSFAQVGKCPVLNCNFTFRDSPMEKLNLWTTPGLMPPCNYYRITARQLGFGPTGFTLYFESRWVRRETIIRALSLNIGKPVYHFFFQHWGCPAASDLLFADHVCRGEWPQGNLSSRMGKSHWWGNTFCFVGVSVQRLRRPFLGRLTLQLGRPLWLSGQALRLAHLWKT